MLKIWLIRSLLWSYLYLGPFLTNKFTSLGLMFRWSAIRVAIMHVWLLQVSTISYIPKLGVIKSFAIFYSRILTKI